MNGDEYQSSSEVTGDLTKDKNVLKRGRVTLIARGQGPVAIYAPYFYVSKTIDLSSLNTDGIIPEVEVWAVVSSFPGAKSWRKVPYALAEAGTKNMGQYTKVELGENISKTDGYTLGLTISLWSITQETTVEFYYTVRSSSVASTDPDLFPDDGSWT